MQKETPNRPGPHASEDLERADVATLLDALRDPAESVRTAALRALVRLPLAQGVWLEVSAYVLLAITSEDQIDRGIPCRNKGHPAVGLYQRLSYHGVGTGQRL